jgi:stage V sporulation protein AF
MEIINKDFKGTINTINKELRVDKSFDLIYRTFKIDDKKASLYFIDGFAKDDIFQKLMQYFMDMNNEDNIDNYYDFLKTKLPYIEVDVCDELEKLKLNVLSGVIALVIEDYERIILIDARTYPMRSIEEPTKDKVFRGSKDGFVETLVSNTALIRRRIRDINLTFEIYTVGRISKTDVVVAYMNNKVDKKLLSNIKEKLNSIKVDSLSMNQESLAECLYKGKWFNPFPKFQYTERPDTSASAIMEGHIVILVDNSPSAMIIPVSFFDILEEADDYYFPPITGTYFRFTRVIVTLVALFLTPVYLLFAYGYVDTPKWLEFIIIKDTINVPILAQLLILEVAIDGMKLAAVNTPDMLNTPLSIIIGVVLGDAAVSSGWFNNEIMLYMAFVAFANFTHGSFELGYALKFLRIFLLLTTSIFGLWGFIGGVIIILLLVAFNKTVSNESYIYPLIPFNGKKLINIFIRRSKNHMNN